ncbi:LbetaH domain-containing protein [Pseudolactococcus yaeyamensis]
MIDYFFRSERLVETYLKRTKNKSELIAKYYRNKLFKQFGIIVGKNSDFSAMPIFPHPQNIVIGSGVKFGRNVIIYHNTTFGVKSRDILRESMDNPQNELTLYPTIGDNVVVYSGATIVGGITIGDNAIIGAGVVVAEDVPENSIVLARNEVITKKIGR